MLESSNAYPFHFRVVNDVFSRRVKDPSVADTPDRSLASVMKLHFQAYVWPESKV